jgi:hypothetical protein
MGMKLFRGFQTFPESLPWGVPFFSARTSLKRWVFPGRNLPDSAPTVKIHPGMSKLSLVFAHEYAEREANLIASGIRAR